jgi:hypothetical protein
VTVRNWPSIALSLLVIFNMSVNFLFYSTQGSVNNAVVFFVVVSDFANERNQHSETTTDKSHHDLSIHRTRFANSVSLASRSTILPVRTL